MSDCLESEFKKAREKYIQTEWLWIQVGPGRLYRDYRDVLGIRVDEPLTEVWLRPPFLLKGEEEKPVIYAPAPELPPLELQTFELEEWCRTGGVSISTRINGPSMKAIGNGDADAFRFHEMKHSKEQIIRLSKVSRSFFRRWVQREKYLFEYSKAVYNYGKREALVDHAYCYLRNLYIDNQRAFQLMEALHSGLMEDN
tara:strand:+ start:817 stop:1410 length:594 start_codon:yes stop_codon:yes gene_type:complete